MQKNSKKSQFISMDWLLVLRILMLVLAWVAASSFCYAVGFGLAG